MMNLDVIGLASVFETVEHVKHPQRPTAIEKLGMQVGDAILQFAPGAWRGQHDPADMKIKIDVAVDPDRIGELQRHLRQPSPQHRR